MILTEYEKFDNTYNFVVKNSWGDDWEDELISFDNDIDNKYYNENLLDDINPDNSNIDDINRIFTFGEFITKIVSDSKDAEKYINANKYYIIDYYVDINKTIYDIIDKIVFNKENDENKNLEIIEGINNDIRTFYEKKKNIENIEINEETLEETLELNKLLLLLINSNDDYLRNFITFIIKDKNMDRERNALITYKNEYDEFKELEKNFKYTKGVVNYNYYKRFFSEKNYKNIELIIPIVDKIDDKKIILYNKIEIENKNLKLVYQGNYYIKNSKLSNNYNIYHGIGKLILLKDDKYIF
jgi:hypothetical protein